MDRERAGMTSQLPLFAGDDAVAVPKDELAYLREAEAAAREFIAAMSALTAAEHGHRTAKDRHGAMGALLACRSEVVASTERLAAAVSPRKDGES